MHVERGITRKNVSLKIPAQFDTKQQRQPGEEFAIGANDLSDFYVLRGKRLE